MSTPNYVEYAPNYVGPMGFETHDSSMSISGKVLTSKRMAAVFANEDPVVYRQREARPVSPTLLKKWEDFQLSKGRERGSNDMTLLVEWIFGERWVFLAQDIGSCFPAGTLIRMADGSHKPIEDMRLFSEVLTAEGNTGHVTQIGGREVDEDIYEIKAWGHTKLRLTREHPILTKRGYVKAEDVRLDDYVSVPKYAPQTSTYLQTEEHVKLNQQMRLKVASGKTETRHAVFGGGHVRIYRTVPDGIELTSDFGWLCGIYLAEGCTDGNKIVWTFHSKELDTHVKKLTTILSEVFGVEASVTTGKGKRKTVTKVSVHSVAWVSMFDSLFGRGSGSKKLHGDLSSGPHEFLRGVYEGWMAGDGHVQESGKTDGVTISKALAMDMLAIANVIGLNPTIQAHDPNISHGVVERQRRYDVIVSPTDKRMCWDITESTIWKKVRTIGKERFVGKVYNFEVHGDNSYVADGIGVHNCVYSNMFRAWISRMCWEIVLLGDLEKWTGTGQFGINSIAPHCVQYGFAREIANMKGSDGLYCAPMIKSLQRGIVTCSTPAVKELHEQNNAGGDTNYPEPRSVSLYRKIGDWYWNAKLRPYLQCALRESVEVTNPDQHQIQDAQSKPMIICSGLAFKKIGRHKDGFDIHGIDPNDSWSHNMAFEGFRVSSDKNRFTRLHTISWVRPGEDPEKQCFNLPPEELAKVYRKDVDVASLGEIEGMPIAPPSL